MIFFLNIEGISCYLQNIKFLYECTPLFGDFQDISNDLRLAPYSLLEFQGLFTPLLGGWSDDDINGQKLASHK